MKTYLHLEKLHNNLFRICFYGEPKDVEQLLKALDGSDAHLVENVLESGNIVRKVTHVDELNRR